MIFEEKTLTSEIIYEGKILNLRRDKVTVQKGTSTREIIEHNGGSVIAALTENNSLVMVKQYRKAVEQVLLEVPAGKRDGDESPLDVAVRELKEETGYSAKEFIHISDFYPTPGYSQEKLSIFLARDLTPGETDFDDNEAIDIEEIPLEKLVNMAINGEIPDGKTQAAILLTELYLKQEASKN